MAYEHPSESISTKAEVSGYFATVAKYGFEWHSKFLTHDHKCTPVGAVKHDVADTDSDFYIWWEYTRLYLQ